MKDNCIFCKVINRELAATLVFEDEISLAFLDHRPLFRGHSLLVPKNHFETLSDLPRELACPFFSSVQVLTKAVELALGAEGSFVAMNNRVSQSVPHLHVHIVPRNKKDGLKGFFWPRTKYANEAEILEVQQLIRSSVTEIQNAFPFPNS